MLKIFAFALSSLPLVPVASAQSADRHRLAAAPTTQVTTTAVTAAQATDDQARQAWFYGAVGHILDGGTDVPMTDRFISVTPR